MTNGNIEKLVALLKTDEEGEKIRTIVLAEKKPIIAEEVAKKTSGRFKSLRHTTHALRTLESLASKGVLGKFKRDRFYYFATPKEAVMQRKALPKELIFGSNINLKKKFFLIKLFLKSSSTQKPAIAPLYLLQSLFHVTSHPLES